VVSTCQVIGWKDSFEETSSKSRRLSPQRRGWRVCYFPIRVNSSCHLRHNYTHNNHAYLCWKCHQSTMY